MTTERKREIERNLNNIEAQLREIVLETGYGLSLMVLPHLGDVSYCTFIHECRKEGGLISVPDGNFNYMLDAEFEYDSKDEEEED